MSKPIVYLAVLVLVAGLLTPVVLADEEAKVPKARTVTIAELMKAPESFRGVPCEFDLMFHEFSQVYNPYFTRFIPENYLNFSAWSDTQSIWKLEEYNRDFSYLFISKENPALPDFLKLKRFDRIKVVGTIQDTFRGSPWIEVHSMTPMKGKLTEKSLIHRVRGDLAMKKNRPRIAVKEFSQALKTPGLPLEYTYDLTKNLGMALYRAKDYHEAEKVFARLAALNPADKHNRVLAAQSSARSLEKDQVQAAAKGVIIEEAKESGANPEEETDQPKKGEGGQEATAPHSNPLK